MATEPEMTMKNTKAEILDALSAALSRAQAAEKGRLDPIKTEKAQTEKRVVASAKEAVEQNIFSVELNNKFKDLQAAITVEETRLNELYSVSTELQKLTLIIEAGRERQEQIESENSEKLESARIALELLKTEHSEKKAELQEEYDSITKKLKTDRAREAEEFGYSLKREREKENNAWEDVKAAREAALQNKEEKAAAMLAEAEAKAEYVKSLESKVEGIADLVDKEKAAAVKSALSELNREHDHKAALIEKDYQSAIARSEDKNAYLEKELESLGKANVALQNKLDKAYAEIKELATKTVESASGVKIIGGGAE
ncbi:MAG: hypothetical protein FWG30_10225 [Eubacteriaceae bacterium]|nr:hypothetical protein [Eubacteriaceae bacterium]